MKTEETTRRFGSDILDYEIGDLVLFPKDNSQAYYVEKKKLRLGIVSNVANRTGTLTILDSRGKEWSINPVWEDVFLVTSEGAVIDEKIELPEDETQSKVADFSFFLKRKQ